MDDDCLKLTAYFDERQRSADRFLSDAMLDLYGQRRIAASVVLRGIAGFGLRHHLRSDQLLSLSEDPPVTVVAVDTRAAIEALLDPLRAIDKRALVTLERARLIRDEPGPVDLTDERYEATKLTIYVGRKERIGGVPAHIALCDLMHRRGLAGASVFLGVDGTAHGRRERAHFFGGNADVPVMIIAVGSGERIGAVAPELVALLRRPLVTVERVRICKRDGELLNRPHALPGTDAQGRPLWQKLMIYTSESARYDGVPIHRALVRRLWQRRLLQGATALRGIWGFHDDRGPHGDRLLALRRDVPVVTILIDTPDNITAAFDTVDELTREQGLVTSEMVPALVSVRGDDRRGGSGIARHAY